MTPTRIKKDENFLCGLEIPEFEISLYLIYTGGDKLQYHVFWKDKILFRGGDFRLSPMYDIDSIEATISLLDFIVLQPGDVDKEYFDKYTDEQTEWANSSECSDLKSLVISFSSSEEPYRTEAKQYFQKTYLS